MSDARLRQLERRIQIDTHDYGAWKALIHARLRTDDPLIVSFYAGRGHPSSYRRRWISVELYDIYPHGTYQSLHVLPRGWPWSQYRSYKGARMEEPHWSSGQPSGSLFRAEGLHFGLLTPEEELVNQENADIQDRIEDHWDGP